MAFSTKVTFVPRDSETPSLSYDMVDYGLNPNVKGFPKWELNGFVDFKSLHFRVLSSGTYIDFVSVLSFEEFLVFIKEHKLGKTLTQFSLTDLKKVRYNWVIIEVYEWESGMG
ncbi:MAG TPA: hypothetical protein DHV28_08575 [Ignavibacteriales bacterium]|nr:hypothetical protein [Ignavibacteriales bacterium]